MKDWFKNGRSCVVRFVFAVQSSSEEVLYECMLYTPILHFNMKNMRPVGSCVCWSAAVRQLTLGNVIPTGLSELFSPYLLYCNTQKVITYFRQVYLVQKLYFTIRKENLQI
jgi:hypothetical protein